MGIDHYGEDPSYVQLANLLRRQMQDGTYPPKTLLPSIRQLAAEYNLAPGTIRHGLEVLISEGLIRAVRGRGCVVLDRPAGDPPRRPKKG